MITLHDLYEQDDQGAVREAVVAFGARHLLRSGEPDAGPDWKWAERHFTCLIETIMGAAAPPAPGSGKPVVRRAENAAVGFLLAVSSQPDYRCPICVKQQGQAAR
ncbi:hypothetical protein [Streptomyces monomycini]|uniref:hypothetical protein n=1 Tax=Streptomyces monomycini TaxID=371720 RepID=UPI0004ABADB6|nr:hypothetical protein [Streptomyces monomycini]